MLFLRLACIERLEVVKEIDLSHPTISLQQYLAKILARETVEPEPKPKNNFLTSFLWASAVLPAVILLLVFSNLFTQKQWENFWNQFLEN